MAVAKSGTLTPNTVATVTVSVSAFGSSRGVTVTNRSEAGTIWVRLDGQNPTIAGDDCYPVFGTRTFFVPEGGTTAAVKMIATSALEYTVDGTL